MTVDGADNLGLLPYRRRIVAVSECLPSDAVYDVVAHSQKPSWTSHTRGAMRQADIRGDPESADTIHRRAYVVSPSFPPHPITAVLEAYL